MNTTLEHPHASDSQPGGLPLWPDCVLRSMGYDQSEIAACHAARARAAGETADAPAKAAQPGLSPAEIDRWSGKHTQAAKQQSSDAGFSTIQEALSFCGPRTVMPRSVAAAMQQLTK